MAEQIEYVVRAEKDQVIQWIHSLATQDYHQNQNPGITDRWKALSLYNDREGDAPQDRCDIEVLPLDSHTLLRVQNLKGDWAMLESVWARLQAELARLEQYGQASGTPTEVPARKPGRPRDPDIEEAYERIEINGEDRQAVLGEIIERLSKPGWTEEQRRKEKERFLSGIKYRKKPARKRRK